MTEYTFKESDDVEGTTTLEVWGDGSRATFMITHEDGRHLHVYIKNAGELARMILASSWGYGKDLR